MKEICKFFLKIRLPVIKDNEMKVCTIAHYGGNENSFAQQSVLRGPDERGFIRNMQSNMFFVATKETVSLPIFRLW